MTWLKSEVEVLVAIGKAERVKLDNKIEMLSQETEGVAGVRIGWITNFAINAGVYFDSNFNGPRDFEEKSPTESFKPSTDDHQYQYATLNGVVVHGSKVNNMLWAIFGRACGFSVRQLRYGAHVNQFLRDLKWDGETSQHSINLGSNIYDMYEIFERSAVVPSVLTKDNVLGMEEPENQWGVRILWPSLYDAAPSSIVRPDTSLLPEAYLP